MTSQSEQFFGVSLGIFSLAPPCSEWDGATSVRFTGHLLLTFHGYLRGSSKFITFTCNCSRRPGLWASAHFSCSSFAPFKRRFGNCVVRCKPSPERWLSGFSEQFLPSFCTDLWIFSFW